VSSAAQHSGGQMRLGVSATVASAVLYGAVVVFGLGPASPSAQGSETDRSTPVVRVPRDPAVSRPGSRLPQVSPGRARRHRHGPGPLRGESVTSTAIAAPIASADAGPQAGTPVSPEPKAKVATPPTTVVQSAPPTTTTPVESNPVVTVPAVTVTTPVVTVAVPETPVQLPPVPALPTPTLPGLQLP